MVAVLGPFEALPYYIHIFLVFYEEYVNRDEAGALWQSIKSSDSVVS
jgi:hypothetical protein